MIIYNKLSSSQFSSIVIKKQQTESNQIIKSYHCHFSRFVLTDGKQRKNQLQIITLRSKELSSIFINVMTQSKILMQPFVNPPSIGPHP